MCGICGCVGFGVSTVPTETVIRMRDTMQSRGPDDAGFWCQGRAALGHRRLSIIDLSPDGHQPMSNESDTVQVVFNGEI